MAGNGLPGAPMCIGYTFGMIGRQGNNGGRSSVGRASDCDSDGRGFDPHRPPHLLSRAKTLQTNGPLAQLAEQRTLNPQVVGSIPTWPTTFLGSWTGYQFGKRLAKVAELVDALDLGSSGATRGSSSLPFRTMRPATYVTTRHHQEVDTIHASLS